MVPKSGDISKRGAAAKDIAASMIAATAVPLGLNWADHIKVRMQGVPAPGSTAPPYDGGFAETARRIWTEEGLFALYGRGMLPALARECTVIGTRIGAYPAVRDGVSLHLGQGKSGGEAALASKLGAGVILGALSGLLGSPFDLLRIRQQEPRGNLLGLPTRPYLADLHGLFGMLRGSGVNILRSVCMTCGTVPVYEHTKHLAKVHLGLADAPALHVGAGVVAGLIGTTAAAPADVVRTRVMQTGGGSGGGMLGAVASIQREHGLRGFFRGWVPAYMRVGPLFVLMPALVEQVRRRVFDLDYIV